MAQIWGPLTIWYDPAGHPEFPEILDPRIAGEADTLMCNEVSLAEAERLPRTLGVLHSYGYHRVHFYLHGNGSTHDAFINRKGAWEAVLKASAAVAEAGWEVGWTVMLDTRNLGEIHGLVEVGRRFDGVIRLALHPHLIGRRTWAYEKVRPTLAQIRELLPDIQDLDPSWTAPLEELTETHWLSRWQAGAPREEFMDPLEPRAWPPQEPIEQLALHILEDRQVYLNPQCAPLIHLGGINEDKAMIQDRLAHLPDPIPALETRAQPRDHGDLLHPSGASVRYKLISEVLFPGPHHLPRENAR